MASNDKHQWGVRLSEKEHASGLERTLSVVIVRLCKRSASISLCHHLPSSRARPARFLTWVACGSLCRLIVVRVLVYHAFVLHSPHFLDRGWDGPDDEGWLYPRRNRGGTLFIKLLPRQIRTIFQRLWGDANHWAIFSQAISLPPLHHSLSLPAYLRNLGLKYKASSIVFLWLFEQVHALLNVKFSLFHHLGCSIQCPCIVLYGSLNITSTRMHTY